MVAEKSASGREQATIVCRKIPVLLKLYVVRLRKSHYLTQVDVQLSTLASTRMVIFQTSDWLGVPFAHTLGQYNFLVDAGYGT